MLGQDWRGFKHDHQCRVSNAALREAARLASERPNRTRSSRSSPRRARSRRRCLASVPCGTTTPRNVIAAHRGIVPEEFVSVHRGTLVGARKLDLTVVKGRIRYADLASQLRVLSAGDVEAFYASARVDSTRRCSPSSGYPRLS